MKSIDVVIANEQDPPVTLQVIEAVGLTWYGRQIRDKNGLYLGDFDSVKWVQTENGPGLRIGARIYDYPLKHGAPTPLDMVRQEYYQCVWPGCECGTCRVRETEHSRGMPVMFYVYCPECGARGPESWERAEAVRRWKRAGLKYQPEVLGERVQPDAKRPVFNGVVLRGAI